MRQPQRAGHHRAHSTTDHRGGKWRCDPRIGAQRSAYQGATGFTNVGFQQLPTGSDTPALSAGRRNRHRSSNPSEVGAVFNAANDLSAGGLNSTNLTEFNTDMQAVVTGLDIVNNPTALASIEANEQAGTYPQGQALTAQQEQALTDHSAYSRPCSIKPSFRVPTNLMECTRPIPMTPARSTNDNMLDMVDIVNNDAALAAAAGDVSVANNGAQPNQTFGADTGRVGKLPGYLNGVGGVNDHGGTILPYQDNQTQTNFWSQFSAKRGEPVE